MIKNEKNIFLPLWISTFLSGFIFLLPEEIPLIFCIVQVINNLSLFLSEKVFVSPSYLKDIFAVYEILG